MCPGALTVVILEQGRRQATAQVPFHMEGQHALEHMRPYMVPGMDMYWPKHFFRATGGEEVITVGVEIVQPTESRAFGTFFIDVTHVVAELGTHEVPATV
ncbi:MAG: hypothetical protein OXF88_05270 [Rhodobacteraceae bacterium]|nr:hypothetical protein [Paracoccaceae bacterium]